MDLLVEPNVKNFFQGSDKRAAETIARYIEPG